MSTYQNDNKNAQNASTIQASNQRRDAQGQHQACSSSKKQAKKSNSNAAASKKPANQPAGYNNRGF